MAKDKLSQLLELLDEQTLSTLKVDVERKAKIKQLVKELQDPFTRPYRGQ